MPVRISLHLHSDGFLGRRLAEREGGGEGMQADRQTTMDLNALVKEIKTSYDTSGTTDAEKAK